jgi:dephospho-CoA kinase
MPSLAITGGFGTGKTTVLEMFAKHGARTTDMDSIVHEVLRAPPIIQKIGNLLGEEVLTRSQGRLSVSRKQVASIIFNDPPKRIAVENLIHPIVMRRVKSIMKDSARRDPSTLTAFEVPLLYEAGYERFFDKVVLVYCRRKIALRRLQKKGVTRDDAIRRIRAQMPMYLKKKSADFAIDNSGAPSLTEARVLRIMKKVHAKA